MSPYKHLHSLSTDYCLAFADKLTGSKSITNLLMQFLSDGKIDNLEPHLTTGELTSRSMTLPRGSSRNVVKGGAEVVRKGTTPLA